MTTMTKPTYGVGAELPPYPEPEEVDVATEAQTVELEILAEVYDSAMTRAESQGQKLAAVARACLFNEAAKTPEDAPAQVRPATQADQVQAAARAVRRGPGQDPA
jgi:hypothetical protein